MEVEKSDRRLRMTKVVCARLRHMIRVISRRDEHRFGRFLPKLAAEDSLRATLTQSTLVTIARAVPVIAARSSRRGRAPPH
jgi:hypothetical protein